MMCYGDSGIIGVVLEKGPIIPDYGHLAPSRQEEHGAGVHQQRAAAALDRPSFAHVHALTLALRRTRQRPALGWATLILGDDDDVAGRRRAPLPAAGTSGGSAHCGRWPKRPGSRRMSPLGGTEAPPLAEHGRCVAAGGILGGRIFSSWIQILLLFYFYSFNISSF